ncbi:MAG: hypothetical protein KatS3mg076_0215 [Candidatus Binatia bacterium]|nr:MAG: hypothetical protein KatS3mg076_0215 [Candidatus Binatia bacterium]
MRTRPPTLLWTVLLTVPFGSLARGEADLWDMSLALRVSARNASGAVVVLLPPTDERQRLDEVRVASRGLALAEDGSSVRFRVPPRTTRRVRLDARIAVARPETAELPEVPLYPAFPDELLPYASPAPLFPSRSILVREFLERHAAPPLREGRKDLVRVLLDVVRAEIRHRRKGKTLVLDVLRKREAKRIGIERTFVTFLRCAGVPARFVEGVDLGSTTRKKRVFWTEFWYDGRWWSASASRGWTGAPPSSYVALARDGERPVRVEGPVTVDYRVSGLRLVPTPKEATPGAE